MLSFSESLKITSEWWSSKCDDVPFPIPNISSYTRQTILKDNPTGVDLCELNKYVITLDSQQDLYGKPEPAHLSYLKWRELSHLEGMDCIDLQRPYISFYCPKNMGKYITQNLSGWDWVEYDFESQKITTSPNVEFPVPLTVLVFANGIIDQPTTLPEKIYSNYVQDVVEISVYGPWPLKNSEPGVVYAKLMRDLINICEKYKPSE